MTDPGCTGETGRCDERGTLVLVATPIGNLGDLSPRAVAALGAADLICCEDTRRTRGLLTHAAIHGQTLMAFHEHNERQQAPVVLDRLARGQTVALVSDAGTPAVSDPGGWLVAEAVAAGYRVTIVPGPNAALAALVVSGLPAGQFCFEGFLPRRGRERHARLQAICADSRTTVLHEAPGRLAATMADLAGSCGEDRPVAVVRELTKLHEEVWRGSAGAAAETFAARAAEHALRGEVVIVVAGAVVDRSAPADDEVVDALRDQIRAGSTVRDASAAVAVALGVPRRRAYELALRLTAADVGIASRGRVKPDADRTLS